MLIMQGRYYPGSRACARTHARTHKSSEDLASSKARGLEQASRARTLLEHGSEHALDLDCELLLDEWERGLSQERAWDLLWTPDLQTNGQAQT